MLGATGMLGHKLMQVLSDLFQIIGTDRCSATHFYFFREKKNS